MLGTFLKFSLSVCYEWAWLEILYSIIITTIGIFLWIETKGVNLGTIGEALYYYGEEDEKNVSGGCSSMWEKFLTLDEENRVNFLLCIFYIIFVYYICNKVYGT